MVDVSHDRDHRRPLLELLRLLVLRLDLVRAVFGDEFDLVLELVGDRDDRVLVEPLIDRRHEAEAETGGDHLGRRLFHGRGQLGQGDVLVARSRCAASTATPPSSRSCACA